MFYFLDGVEAVPLCRGCLTRQERDRAFLGPDAAVVGAPALPEMFATGASNATSGASRDLGSAVETYLREELDRIASSLEKMPEEDAGAVLARQLERKARQELLEDRLGEAVLCMADLRRNLADLERAADASVPPWDETVEELLERVNARARALAPSARRGSADRAGLPTNGGSTPATSPPPGGLA
jgi:hypothetical protein